MEAVALAVKSRRTLRTGRVTASQALRLARSFGVTLDLSNDLELAGKWKHGWIPLDAVAVAVKAKRYHGGHSDGMRGSLPTRGARMPKGRAGSAVEARREVSGGRIKGKLPTRARKARKATPVGAPLEHQDLRYVTPGVSKAPRRAPHVSAEQLKDGRTKLTDSKSGESVKAVHLASFHNQGHTITGIRGGLMHTRDDSGASHVYDPATGRAANVSRTRAMGERLAAQARERNASVRQPKIAELSEGQLRDIAARYGERSPQGEAVRAELARRSKGRK